MRLPFVPLIACALSLIGCSSQPQAPDGDSSPPATATVAATTPMPESSASSAGDSSEGPPKGADTKDTAATAKRIVESGAAAYFPQLGKVLCQQSYAQEGTGVGRKVMLLGPASSQQVIAEYAADEDETAGNAKLVTAAITQLNKSDWILLEQTEWKADSASLKLSAPSATLSWVNNVFTAGKGTVTLKPATPFTVRPTKVHHAKDVPQVLVELTYDPGERYADGFNLYTELRLVDLR